MPEADEVNQTIRTVVEQFKKGNLSLLYLFDPEADQKKHERFETTLLNHPTLNVSLKAFKCGRIDVTGDETYGKKAPLFVVFDAKGNCVGEASLHGYRTEHFFGGHQDIDAEHIPSRGAVEDQVVEAVAFGYQ